MISGDCINNCAPHGFSNAPPALFKLVWIDGWAVEFIGVAKLSGGLTDFAKVSSPRVKIPDVEIPYYDPKPSPLLFSVLERNYLSEFVLFVSSNCR